MAGVAAANMLKKAACEFTGVSLALSSKVSAKPGHTFFWQDIVSQRFLGEEKRGKVISL